jgi:ATP-dependent RNA helicase MSS116
MIVLDEADRLIEGFAKESKRIVSYLPRKRQVLLFSATVSTRLRLTIQSSNILPNTENKDDDEYVQINCGVDEKVSRRIEQSYLILPDMESYVSTLVRIVVSVTRDDPHHKILVFFPAARLARYFCDVFKNIDVPVVEMHSRMSQSARNKARQAFTEQKACVMLTSDVSARGIDYNVTLVVQYGAPFGETLFTHRLGRTARAGRQGKGLLVLLPFESGLLRGSMRRRLGLFEESTLLESYAMSSDMEKKLEKARALVRCGQSRMSVNAEAAYLSFLAYYEEYAAKNVRGTEILDAAAIFAVTMGVANLPSMPERLQDKLSRR